MLKLQMILKWLNETIGMMSVDRTSDQCVTRVWWDLMRQTLGVVLVTCLLVAVEKH